MADHPKKNQDNELYRWQALFQRAAEPIFLLNGKRRVLFVNQAFEKLAGLTAAEARGLVCKKRREAEPGSPEALAGALAPPAEVLAGQPAQQRRVVVGPGGARKVWDIDFMPLRGPDGLLAVLGRVTPLVVEPPQSARLAEELVALRAEWAGRWRVEPGGLPAMRRVVDQARLASQSETAVWLRGEPGAGKAHLARCIHYASPRRERWFAAVDCERLPLPALAPTLLGVAGLLRRAGLGTIYLREPSALPRELQSRLCEWLAEAGPDRPRIIAGSSRDPAAEIRANRLLEELQVALGTLVIHLPPLRERREELAELVERIQNRLAGDGKPPPPSAEALELLRAHAWPENLRELVEVIAGAAARAAGGRIEPAHLPAYLRQAVHLSAIPGKPADRPLPLDPLLEQTERRLITLALRMARGNKTKAAELLAIWRPRLLRRMEALGIADPVPGEEEEADQAKAGE